MIGEACGLEFFQPELQAGFNVMCDAYKSFNERTRGEVVEWEQSVFNARIS